MNAIASDSTPLIFNFVTFRTGLLVLAIPESGFKLEDFAAVIVRIYGVYVDVLLFKHNIGDGIYCTIDVFYNLYFWKADAILKGLGVPFL